MAANGKSNTANVKSETKVTAHYDGKPVTILRAAKEGDIGWNADVKVYQVLIEFEDGTEIVVAKRDLT